MIMLNIKWLFALVCLFYLARSDKPDLCGPQFANKCICATQQFESASMFVVNCTNGGFVNPDILQHLPSQTQVVIFHGNNFSSLPKNVFGEKENVPFNLDIIDLADNNIVDIPGKAFHHVSGVRKLILNHNRIRLAPIPAHVQGIPAHVQGIPAHVHSRVFSNFFNLTELQLINAFEDNLAEDFPSALLEVFSNSNLSKLTHLHLDNNHLKSFEDQTFCDMPELRELYLDGNDLTDINFNISCLHNLQRISLKSNNIENLSHKTLKVLDSFPAKGQSLKVDLQCNPWICRSAVYQNKTQWTTSTKFSLIGTYLCSAVNTGCPPEKLGLFGSNISVMGQILIVVTVLVFCIVGAVFFFKGNQIRNKFNPLLDTVSHKMQYTTLRRREDPEVDV